MSQFSTVGGSYGQASPQPIVTAQSACSCISRSSLRGLRSLRSNPASAIASTTVGHTSGAGDEPADSARMSAGACRSKNACAICDRPALWLQTNSTSMNRHRPSGTQGRRLVAGGCACGTVVSSHNNDC
jgi:hypothetical protein